MDRKLLRIRTKTTALKSEADDRSGGLVDCRLRVLGQAIALAKLWWDFAPPRLRPPDLHRSGRASLRGWPFAARNRAIANRSSQHADPAHSGALTAQLLSQGRHSIVDGP